MTADGGPVWEDPDERGLAIVEFLGSLAYGQLRSFAATARTIAVAPDARMADQLAAWAATELARYQRLRDHLGARTELATAVMERQRDYFDDYFDRAPMGDWFEASVFFALGLPMASDFIRAVAPTLDPASAQVVLDALDRQDVEAAALEQLSTLLTDDDARERARALTADLLGRALTGFQGAMSNTDALRVLLTADLHDEDTGEHRVKQLALQVLQAHRRRVIALGLEDLDDVL